MNENPGDNTPNPAAESPAPAEPAAPIAAAPIVAAPKKKKKTGLIIGIIAAVLVIGGGVAAYFLFFNTNPTKILNEALAKIIDDKAPEYMHEEGTYKITIPDSSVSSFSGTINSDSNLKTFSSIDDTTLKVEGDGMGMSLEASAHIAIDDGSDFYAKIDNSTMLENVLPEYANIESSLIADKWFHIDTSSATSFISSNSGMETGSATEALNGLSKLVKQYKEYAFLTAAAAKTDTYKQAKSTLYEVSIDKEKFLEAYKAAFGDVDTGTEIDTSVLPKIYVEIDGDYNFTRVIFDLTTDDDKNIVLDLNLSYPDKLTIDMPTDASELTDLISSFMSESTGGGIVNPITVDPTTIDVSGILSGLSECEDGAIVDTAFDTWVYNEDDSLDDYLYNFYSALNDEFYNLYGTYSSFLDCDVVE